MTKENISHGILDKERYKRAAKIAAQETVRRMHDEQHMSFRKIGEHLGVTGSRARGVYIEWARDKRYYDTGELAELPIRTKNALYRAGIRTKNDLLQALRSGELPLVPEIGRVGVLAVYEMLRMTPAIIDKHGKCRLCGQRVAL